LKKRKTNSTVGGILSPGILSGHQLKQLCTDFNSLKFMWWQSIAGIRNSQNDDVTKRLDIKETGSWLLSGHVWCWKLIFRKQFRAQDWEEDIQNDGAKNHRMDRTKAEWLRHKITWHGENLYLAQTVYCWTRRKITDIEEEEEEAYRTRENWLCFNDDVDHACWFF